MEIINPCARRPRNIIHCIGKNRKNNTNEEQDGAGDAVLVNEALFLAAEQGGGIFVILLGGVATCRVFRGLERINSCQAQVHNGSPRGGSIEFEPAKLTRRFFFSLHDNFFFFLMRREEEKRGGSA